MVFDRKDNNKISKSFISGGLTGLCIKTLIAPIERVKYLFIVSHSPKQTSNRLFTYKDFLKDWLYIIRNNGIRNLWRGNTMNLLKVFPHMAIKFSVFDYLRGKYYVNDFTNLSNLILLLSGAASGVAALTCTTPLQFIRVRMAMQKHNFTYDGIMNATKLMYNRQGVIGFYSGYGASVIGITMSYGIQFYIFAKSKEWVMRVSSLYHQKWYIDFMIGGISAIGQLMAYPFDILHKRMQGQRLLLEKQQINKVLNYKELICSIRQNQGLIKGFYKGITLNLFGAPIGVAFAWTLKNYLNRKLDRSYDL